MVESDGITETQSFSERTLKYGRNLMAVAVAANVFAFSPAIDLAKSKPLNFVIVPGQEHWIWILFLCALIYYAVRFFWLAIVDFNDWTDKHGYKLGALRDEVNEQLQNLKNCEDAVVDEQSRINHPSTPFGVAGPLGLPGPEGTKEALAGNIVEAQSSVRRKQRPLRLYLWRRGSFWLIDAVTPSALFLAAIVGCVYQMNYMAN